jgi:hypothetical protein
MPPALAASSRPQQEYDYDFERQVVSNDASTSFDSFLAKSEVRKSAWAAACCCHSNNPGVGLLTLSAAVFPCTPMVPLACATAAAHETTVWQRNKCSQGSWIAPDASCRVLNEACRKLCKQSPPFPVLPAAVCLAVLMRSAHGPWLLVLLAGLLLREHQGQQVHARRLQPRSGQPSAGVPCSRARR